MEKTITTPYDVSEHLRTPEEMAAYLGACVEEAQGDAAFIYKAYSDITRAKNIIAYRAQSGAKLD
jgi:DNA-binding phage protein